MNVALPETLTPDSLATLSAAVAEATAGAEPIVLRGGLQVYCAGLGLEALRRPAAERRAAVLRFADILVNLRFAAVPILAVVEGVARGGGVGLVAVADLVLATPAVELSLPEVSLGLQPATILPVLLERLTPAQVRRLALGGHGIDAESAERIGLVDEIVASDDIDAAVRRHLRGLRRARPLAAARVKRATAAPDLADAIRRGAQQTADDLDAPDIIDPIIEFLDGGPPPWSAA